MVMIVGVDQWYIQSNTVHFGCSIFCFGSSAEIEPKCSVKTFKPIKSTESIGSFYDEIIYSNSRFNVVRQRFSHSLSVSGVYFIFFF